MSLQNSICEVHVDSDILGPSDDEMDGEIKSQIGETRPAQLNRGVSMKKKMSLSEAQMTLNPALQLEDVDLKDLSPADRLVM